MLLSIALVAAALLEAGPPSHRRLPFPARRRVGKSPRRRPGQDRHQPDDLRVHRAGDRRRPRHRDVDRAGRRGPALRAAEAELRARCCATRTCSSPPASTSSCGCPRCSIGPTTARSPRADPGYVTAYTGITLLEVPTSLNRSEGDIHADGNPHIHTDPLNAIIIARNILTGLTRVSPADAAYFTEREEDFEKRILEATMGADLVGILTPATAFDLLKTDKLSTFLGATKYQGKPLADTLGGWLKQADAFQGKEMACYHKEWAYFSHRLRDQLRRLHRGQARHSANAEARRGCHRADEGAARFPCSSPRTTSTTTRSSRWRRRPEPGRSSYPRTPMARPASRPTSTS